MSLNNDGDTIQLLNASGAIVDEIAYTNSQEGVAITHP